MLDTVFLQVLNMSYTASYVILAILLARALLNKAPKMFSYALWGVALFRLVCPWSFESVLSLLSIGGRTTEQLRPFPERPITQGIIRSNIDISAAGAVVPAISDMPKTPLLNNGFALIWLVGIAVLLIYSVVMLLKLKKRLKDAVPDTENIYLSAQLGTPFVMGIIRPKIYLPLSLTETEKRYILLHEQTHIRRFDHIIKLVSFFVLCVHWFNPLVWLAFFLSDRDMEMACDEAVIKTLGSAVKKEYAATLLSFSTGRRIVNGTPLAFGEGDMKSRIKNVLNYQKPAFWVIGAAIVGVAALWVGLVANPMQDKTISVEFPAYTENGLVAGETASVEVQLTFPQGWEIRQPAADGNQGVGYFGSSFLSELQIYHDDVFIGQMGFNSFEPYTGEIPAQDYYKTVYPQLRLGRMYAWDAYRPVHTTESFEAAVAAVSYLDQAEIEKHPGAMPDVPVVEALGILAYDKSLKVYIGIQFAEGAVTTQQAEQTAKSIRLIKTERPAAQEERVYFDNLSPEDETLYRQLTRQRGLKEWQIHSLTSLGYTFGDIIDLPETEIAVMLAPGSSFMGDRMTEDEFYKLIEAGILEKDVYVLQSLGYDYDAVIALTPDQLDFIFPNTELIDNLVALGYDRNIVEAAGFLHNGGWETYKELLDEVFTKYLHEQSSSEVKKESEDVPDMAVLNPETPGLTSEQQEAIIEEGRAWQALFDAATAIEDYLRSVLSDGEHGGISVFTGTLGDTLEETVHDTDAGLPRLIVYAVNTDSLNRALQAYTGTPCKMIIRDARCALEDMNRFADVLSAIELQPGERLSIHVSEESNQIVVNISQTGEARLKNEINARMQSHAMQEDCVWIWTQGSVNPVT